ncbi:MAG: hypothetical protein KJ793_02865 [Candidatus Omnitrophica bacterium]|nr:hypothetical protein [Candidatus Omnitrophota bacterium]
MIKSNRAITLLELLITASIFMAIMVSIYSAFQTGMFGYSDIEENITSYQRARLVLERINLDIRNSFAYSDEDSRFTGSENNVRFLSLVDSFKEDNITWDFALVSYNLEGDTLQRLCRKNREALNERSEVEAEEMALEVEELSFSYGYTQDGSREVLFKDFWEDRVNFPLAVKVRLVLGGKTEQEFERTIYLP